MVVMQLYAHAARLMSHEGYQPGSTVDPASFPTREATPEAIELIPTKESTPDVELRNIDEAAQALAHGEIVVMRLYTLGLLIDGTNEEALQRLFEAKQIPYERALQGNRPIVSILPSPQYREGLIAIERHHKDVQGLLGGDDHDLLTCEGHALFYRVHVASQRDYLRIPLIAEEPTGERSMVLLWHDNPYVRLLEEKAREYKGGDFLLTGSSANPTGQSQPTLVEDLHASILPYIAAVVDLQDDHINAVGLEKRGAIPIINLVGHPPTIMRSSPMYKPVPAHATLQSLLGYTQDPQAA